MCSFQRAVGQGRSAVVHHYGRIVAASCACQTHTCQVVQFGRKLHAFTLIFHVYTRIGQLYEIFLNLLLHILAVSFI